MSELPREEIEEIISVARKHGLSAFVVEGKKYEIEIEFSRVAGRFAEASTSGSHSIVEIPKNHTVKSHLVGYFRSARSAGDVVSSETLIGSIEALGLPNEVTAGAAGVLERFLVGDGDAVEYGQALAVIV